MKSMPFNNLAKQMTEAAEKTRTLSSLSGRTEDGATIISGEFALTAPKEELQEALSAELTALAKKVYDNDGIIGHIKAAAEVTHMQMYSITDTILHVKEGAADQIVVSIAFILYLIDVDTALAWSREILSRLTERFPAN